MVQKGIKVAITGGSGYFASCLIPILDNDKKITEVIGVDIAPPKKENITGLKKFVYKNGNVLDYDKLVRLFKGSDCVVHMAFNINGLHNKKKLEALNVTGSINAVEAAAAAGVKKLVFTSSIAAYGAHPDNPVPLNEEHPLRGKGTFFYADQKHRIEEYLDEFEKRHTSLKIVRLRFSTTTGPKATNETVVLYTAPIFIAFPRFQPPVQLLHEEDAARAFHLAIIKDVSGAFNIGSDWKYSAKEHSKKAGAKIIYLPVWLSSVTACLLWHTRLIRFDPSWIKASLYPIVADTTKARKILGWEPKYNSVKIIQSLSKKK